jgi:hypothetical protein
VVRRRGHRRRRRAASTSAAHASRNPAERALRDAHAVSAAFESFQELRGAAARHVMGVDPGHPLF